MHKETLENTDAPIPCVLCQIHSKEAPILLTVFQILVESMCEIHINHKIYRKITKGCRKLQRVYEKSPIEP